jgi:hypothetical protein
LATFSPAHRLHEEEGPMVEFDDPKKLSDEDLIAAYGETSGEPGDPIVDALLAEIKRRGLDV